MSPIRLPRLAWLVLAACCLAHARVAAAGEREEAPEPRLVLPGSHAVQAGQRVALEWTPADDVSELEILLSLDGGRTYPIWISPRLCPRDCRFVWHVPPYGGRSLKMRIRFRRGGREIEGAPTSAIAVAPADAPPPLGLPPLEGDGRAPRTGERGSESRALQAGRREGGPTPPAPRRLARAAEQGPATTRRCAFRAPGHRGPAFVPLRA